eukprot:scaffold1068_cov375-Prasinococcus_capsulatus_cf.AAC.31
MWSPTIQQHSVSHLSPVKWQASRDAHYLLHHEEEILTAPRPQHGALIAQVRPDQPAHGSSQLAATWNTLSLAPGGTYLGSNFAGRQYVSRLRTHVSPASAITATVTTTSLKRCSRMLSARTSSSLPCVARLAVRRMGLNRASWRTYQVLSEYRDQMACLPRDGRPPIADLRQENLAQQSQHMRERGELVGSAEHQAFQALHAANPFFPCIGRFEQRDKPVNLPLKLLFAVNHHRRGPAKGRGQRGPGASCGGLRLGRCGAQSLDLLGPG